MKQIYDFERHSPPVLHENMLRAEQERHRLHWQTALLALSGILFQVVIVLLGYSAIDWYPWLTAICFGYIILSATGFGVIAIAYSHKGGPSV